MSKAQFKYDDSKLRDIYAALTEGQRRKAMRSAFKAEANQFRKAAFNNLRSQMNVGNDYLKGFKTYVYYKTGLGFRVSVGTAGKITRSVDLGNGVKLSLRGKALPVLIWAEDGTKTRRVKQHSAGRMRKYGFMLKTRQQLADTMTKGLQDNFRKYVTKEARKNGCIV